MVKQLVTKSIKVQLTDKQVDATKSSLQLHYSYEE